MTESDTKPDTRHEVIVATGEEVKRVKVGDGVEKVLIREPGMQTAGTGSYLFDPAKWNQRQVQEYVHRHGVRAKAIRTR